MYRLYLAIRYLVTRPINLLGMLGITLSVWALVVVVSLFSGFMVVIERHVQDASADISVTGLPAWADDDAVVAALRDDPNVAATAPRIVHFGMLHEPGKRPPPPPLPGRGALHGGDQPFLFVYGIDPVAERNVSAFAEWIRSPEIPPELQTRSVDGPFAVRNTAGHPGVLIGLERMQREGFEVGDLVELTTGRVGQGGGQRTFTPFTIELEVCGAFKTRHGGFDGNIVFVDLLTLGRYLAPPGARPAGPPEATSPGSDEPRPSVQEIAVRVLDDGDIDDTARRLQSSIYRTIDPGTAMGYGRVLTWRQRNAEFLGSIEHQRGLLKIVLFVILVVSAFLMLATLSMMVTEKTGDIGILTAMGGTPGGVTMTFLMCGLTVTAAGVVLGIGAGIVTSVYLEEIRQFLIWATGVDLFPLDVYNLDRVPCDIDAGWLLQVAGMALLTGLLASALPAWRAARHDPLVSLRGT